MPLPLDMFIPGIPGPLCLGHLKHCQTFFDEAKRAAAMALRGFGLAVLEGGRIKLNEVYAHNITKLPD